MLRYSIRQLNTLIWAIDFTLSIWRSSFGIWALF